MTEKEINRAISYLLFLKSSNNTPSVDVKLSAAIQALEKQIPKKPTGVIEHHVFQGRIICICGKCPHCQNDVGSEIEYCDTCGQRLDWRYMIETKKN